MSMNYGSETVQYTIQAGDLLWELADRYNTTDEAIIAANPGMDPNNLYVGEVISIPDDQLPMIPEQFRRFGPRFGRPFRPGFGGPFRPFGPPFRRFGPFFRGPVVFPVPYPTYPCSPYDPYCPYYPY
jgi:LysM repeat protein